MTLIKRLVPWCGTVRQPPRERAIAEYFVPDDEDAVMVGRPYSAARVVTWAWTFADKKNLIIRDDVDVERSLAAQGYTIVSHDTGRLICPSADGGPSPPAVP